MSGACGKDEVEQKCIQHFGEKHAGNRPLERLRHRLDNIKMNLKDIKQEGVTWTNWLMTGTSSRLF